MKKSFFVVLIAMLMLATATLAEEGVADKKLQFFFVDAQGWFHGEVFARFFYELPAYVEAREVGSDKSAFKTEPVFAYLAGRREARYRALPGPWPLKDNVPYEIFLRYQLAGEWKYRSLKLSGDEPIIWQPTTVAKK